MRWLRSFHTANRSRLYAAGLKYARRELPLRCLKIYGFMALPTFLQRLQGLSVGTSALFCRTLPEIDIRDCPYNTSIGLHPVQGVASRPVRNKHGESESRS